MKKTICLFGPTVPGKGLLKNAYGGGTGGYTRNMVTLLRYFESDENELSPCYHTIRGQLKFDNFIYRMLVDTVSFIRHLMTKRPAAIHILAQYRSALPREFMVVCLSRLFGVSVLYEIKAGAFIEAYNQRSGLYRSMVGFILARSAKVLSEGRLYLPFLKETFDIDAEHFPNVVPDELVDQQDREIISGESLKVLFVCYCYE